MKTRPKNDPVDIKLIFDGIRKQLAEDVDSMEEFFREQTTGDDGIQICLCKDDPEEEANIGFLLGDQDVTVSMDEFLDRTEEVWNSTEIDWEGLIESLSLFRDKIRSRIAKARIQAKKEAE
jgi:hypothetical protein